MASKLRELVDREFDAVMSKDIKGVLSAFADDGVLIDPHYPAPRMVGKRAIAEGLRWGFGSMKTLGFKITGYFESADGQSAAVEVATSHVLKAGMKLQFPQMFVIETENGLITRLQAYEPYGPGGIGGVVLVLTRLKRKITRKR